MLRTSVVIASSSNTSSAERARRGSCDKVSPSPCTSVQLDWRVCRRWLRIYEWGGDRPWNGRK